MIIYHDSLALLLADHVDQLCQALFLIGILESSDESDGVRVQFDGKVGDQVMILSGAWENTVGEITDINESKQCLVINVEMFGRETPVEIGFTDVRLM